MGFIIVSMISYGGSQREEKNRKKLSSLIRHEMYMEKGAPFEDVIDRDYSFHFSDARSLALSECIC